ncbi:1718_t:CDS:10, partial [Scutellospora calospora]
YELVDEELDDHIWIDEKIDEKANSYFEVLLAAARNNNTWKIVGRPTYNYETNLVDEAVDTIVIDEYKDIIMVNNTVDSVVDKKVDKGTKAEELTKQDVFVHEHVKIASLIDNERISIKIISYLQCNKFSINSKILKEFVENEVFSSLTELEPLLIEYNENNLTKLVKKNISLNQKPHCVVTYDETTLAANNDKKTEWRPEGEQKLHPKRQSRYIHVSEFLCEPLRHVHLTVKQYLAYSKILNRYVTETLELLAEQLKRTIDVLKIALLSIIFVFGFDNNSNHNAFAKDALVASRMNRTTEENKTGNERKKYLGSIIKRKGLLLVAAEFAVKKYKSHRRISENIVP